MEIKQPAKPEVCKECGLRPVVYRYRNFDKGDQEVKIYCRNCKDKYVTALDFKSAIILWNSTFAR